jgi:bifunctional DNase/RNase
MSGASASVRVAVIDVRVAVPAGAGVEAGMVVLSEEAEPFRLLRIYIGQTEARAIQTAWTGRAPSRPSTWDLLVSTVGLLDATVRRAVVTAVEGERLFYAALEVERDGAVQSIPCRPSDAIAVAVRVPGAEIWVADEVLATAGRLVDGSRPAPVGEQ